MRYGELVLEVFGSHLGGKMHQGLDNFYLIICYIKLSLIHAGSLWAGQGKGLRKRLYFWRIIIRRFYKMDYLDLEITYDQAGEMLQNSLSTGEMALEVAYSLLLCVSSFSWFYDSGVAKLFPASCDQCQCDQTGVTVMVSCHC